MAEHKTIAFTGGGTAGHVFPAFPVIERLKNAGYRVLWMGSENGMEQELVMQAGIPYFAIPAGKFRRYWSWKNFTDVFRIVYGIFCSLRILRNNRPNLLFSKGGFVSVAPVIAAFLLRIPTLTHESDVNPGLATKLNLKLRACPLVSYDTTLNHLNVSLRSKAHVVGNPVRDAVFQGDRAEGRRIAGLSPDDKRPLLLVLGGSQGAKEINDLIYAALDEILPLTSVVHQCGLGNSGIPSRYGYTSREFFREEMPHLLAAADLAVSRSGAGALWELAASSTPAIFVPLNTATRGDQIVNALLAEEIGFSVTLKDGSNARELLHIVRGLLSDTMTLTKMRNAASKLPVRTAADKITEIIESMIA